MDVQAHSEEITVEDVRIGSLVTLNEELEGYQVNRNGPDTEIVVPAGMTGEVQHIWHHLDIPLVEVRFEGSVFVVVGPLDKVEWSNGS